MTAHPAGQPLNRNFAGQDGGSGRGGPSVTPPAASFCPGNGFSHHSMRNGKLHEWHGKFSRHGAEPQREMHRMVADGTGLVGLNCMAVEMTAGWR